MSVGLERSGMMVETEVVAKAMRRRFTAAEKLRVLREADRCTRPGELGALLRREGLYSSHLSAWRAARKRGELAEPLPARRNPVRTSRRRCGTFEFSDTTAAKCARGPALIPMF